MRQPRERRQAHAEEMNHPVGELRFRSKPSGHFDRVREDV